MNFKAATDALLARVTQDELADALGVSLPSVRQARIDENSTGFRNPPEGWERAVKTLAERQIRHYRKLVSQLNV